MAPAHSAVSIDMLIILVKTGNKTSVQSLITDAGRGSKMQFLRRQELIKLFTWSSVLRSNSVSWVYGSLEGNSRNMSHLNLWLLSITKMHDSKDRTVALTLKNRYLNLPLMISFWPPSWISGKAAGVACILLKLTNRFLNLNIQHIGTKNIYSSA